MCPIRSTKSSDISNIANIFTLQYMGQAHLKDGKWGSLSTSQQSAWMIHTLFTYH